MSKFASPSLIIMYRSIFRLHVFGDLRAETGCEFRTFVSKKIVRIEEKEISVVRRDLRTVGEIDLDKRRTQQELSPWVQGRRREGFFSTPFWMDLICGRELHK